MKSRTVGFAGYLGYKTFSLVLAVLPRGAVLALGAGLGRLAYHLDAKHRRIAAANLAVAFGAEKTPPERDRINRRFFAQLGRSLLDVLKASHMSAARVGSLFEVEGRAHMDRALAAGKGVLLFTGHYGSWELTIPGLSECAPLQAIHRDLDNPFIGRDLARLREKLGAAGTISKFNAARPVLQALARGEIVAILIDLNVLHSSNPVFVDFFGKPAATTPALAAFHLKTGAPIVPMFCEPLPGGRYRMTCHEPLVFERTADHDADVLKITQTCTKMIERRIRERPEPWFWVHKRWNTRPRGETRTA
jgi:KDO2-lipid IV(A) lauroyltransferase